MASQNAHSLAMFIPTATRFVSRALIVIFAAALGAGAASAQMMMLPGQFDVSPTGSALYTVPIEVPPGTGGMSPALTLDYNSDGGNGLLGVGWNLGGLPSIGRCPKTVAQDGERGRVRFNADDRFCMDGQRLAVVSGTYGAANSEYRTETKVSQKSSPMERLETDRPTSRRGPKAGRLSNSATRRIRVFLRRERARRARGRRTRYPTQRVITLP